MVENDNELLELILSIASNKEKTEQTYFALKTAPKRKKRIVRKLILTPEQKMMIKLLRMDLTPFEFQEVIKKAKRYHRCCFCNNDRRNICPYSLKRIIKDMLSKDKCKQFKQI